MSNSPLWEFSLPDTIISVQLVFHLRLVLYSDSTLSHPVHYGSCVDEPTYVSLYQEKTTCVHP